MSRPERTAPAPDRATADSRPILVVEPQFKGSVHSSFNSGLLTAARLAFPREPAVFMGESEHARWVRDALEHLEPGAGSTVEWQPIRVAGALRRIGRVRRTLAEVGSFLGVLRQARRRHARLALFCSVPRLGAATLALLAGRICPRTVVLAVVHDVGSLLPPPAGHAAGKAGLLHRVLRRHAAPNLRFIAPTLLAHGELTAVDPALASRFAALPLPYPWRRDRPAEPLERAPGTLRFGLIGSGSPDRLAPFCRLARALRERFPAARFVLAGHVSSSTPTPEEDLAALDEAPDSPLPPDSLAQRIDALDYAVWFGSAETYRWRMSASFLDALSHVKPTLATATPFSSSSFETMGDIGHLCADESALEAAAAELLTDFPAERYARQCANILEQRSSLAPSAVAVRLRQTVLVMQAE